MDLAMHRSVYVSIDLVARLSIDLAIKSHCAYPLLCFKNRCLPELPLRYFPSSAYGCTIGVGDKTDAKRRRDTDGSEKTPSCQRSNDNTGNNMVTCCRLATTACTFSTSQLPKVARTCGVLYILTSKCASRHNSVHFFDISTSKSGPRAGVFCTFWLRNVLRATTACTFSTSEPPKVARTCGVLYILTSKCASRHRMGVQSTCKNLYQWQAHL